MFNVESSETFSLIIIPLLIFTARVLDMTLDTIRIISVSRGRKFLATFLGFFEIMIWLFAIGQIMTHLTSIAYYLAYAGGFATGIFVGISIEEKIAVGTVVVRVIAKKDSTRLVENIKSEGYGVTSFYGEGATGQVKLIYTAIRRRDVDNVVGIIKRFDPKAFYSIEEVRSASEGIFPPINHYYGFPLRTFRTLFIK
ncbi:Uncharacterised protein [uncultured archaeon]|nr:Uncharacterised protein [uncultured archaeon]